MDVLFISPSYSLKTVVTIVKLKPQKTQNEQTKYFSPDWLIKELDSNYIRNNKRNNYQTDSLFN